MDQKPECGAKKSQQKATKPRRRTRQEKMFDEFIERSKKAQRQGMDGGDDSERELLSEVDESASVLNAMQQAANFGDSDRRKTKSKSALLEEGDSTMQEPAEDYNLYDKLK